MREHSDSATHAAQRVAQREAEASAQQGAMANWMNQSTRQAAQRRAMGETFGATAQRAGAEDEEMMQGKFAQPAQLAEEEELLQGKFDQPAQRVEEEEPLQGKAAPNLTGMPDQLKSGVENLSGMSMDDVKVHYNSAQPAQLNALAFAQGSDIHIGPGQEQHLPHEAWHVVQQRQGRVQPTMQMAEGVPINDDAGLESEADVMGAKALNAGA